MNTMFKRCLFPITLLAFVSATHSQTNLPFRAFSVVRGSGKWDVSGLLWSPNGKQLAVSTVRSFENEAMIYEDYAVQLWKIDALRPQAVVRSPTQRGSGIPLQQMAFSPDSELFALDVNTKGVHEGVPVWRARSGTLLRVLDASGLPLTFSNNREIIAADNEAYNAGGFGVEFRSVKTDRVQRRTKIQTPKNRLRAYSRASSGGGGLPICIVSPDNRQVALMLWRPLRGDSSGAETLLFDPHTGKQKQLLRVGLKENFKPVAFSQNGRILGMLEFWSDTKRAKIFDCRTGRLLSTLVAPAKDSIVALALSTNGKTVALATERGLVQLRESTSGNNIGTLGTAKRSVTSLAFSPNGKTLAIGEKNGAVRLWTLTIP